MFNVIKYDHRFPKHRVLLVSVFVMTVTLALIPSCYNLGLLSCTLAVMGLGMGIVDTISNLSMIQLYQCINVGPFLQVISFALKVSDNIHLITILNIIFKALHFFYGLGAFLAPMVVEPFLLNIDCSSFIDPIPRTENWTASEPAVVSLVNATSTDVISSLDMAQKKSRVHWAFLVMAVLQVCFTFLKLRSLCINIMK